MGGVYKMARARYAAERLARHVSSNMAVYLLTFVIFITGVCYGAVQASILKEGRTELFSYLETGLASLRHTLPVTPGKALVSSLGANLSSAGLIWLSGLTILGFPGAFVILFVRGFSIGFTVAFMVREMSGPGAALAVASVLPHNILAVPALMVASLASLSFSWAVIRTKLIGVPSDVKLAFAKSVEGVAVSAIGLFVASFVQAYVSPAILILAARFV
jgi:stage II sporulation protein M